MEFYAASSGSDSAPRTPSPLNNAAVYYKPAIYDEDNTNAYVQQQQQYWHPPSPPQRSLSAEGSLLSELYEEPQQELQHIDGEWQGGPLRRATFPYVRQDADPVKVEEPAYLHYQQQYPIHYYQQQYPVHHHPHHPQYHHLAAMPGMPPMPVGISHPVQHTDDAASKETQFLRRRCFNCHTTEPPSWRRSTLNPGKIVCNKCGLYERTHLRPRPLRFDELRAGNKQRKNSVASPPAKKIVLGTPRPPARRSSVSSSQGGSDWENDNASSYSSASSSVYNSPAGNFNNAPLPESQEPALKRSPLIPSEELSSSIRIPSAPLPPVHTRNKSHTISFPTTGHAAHGFEYEYPQVASEQSSAPQPQQRRGSVSGA